MFLSSAVEEHNMHSEHIGSECVATSWLCVVFLLCTRWFFLYLRSMSLWKPDCTEASGETKQGQCRLRSNCNFSVKVPWDFGVHHLPVWNRSSASFSPLQNCQSCANKTFETPNVAANFSPDAILFIHFWRSFFGVLPFYATDSLADPITQKTSQWKVVALCISKVLFMSYQADNSLTDVNIICTVLWPKTASSGSPVIDRRALSVIEHSTHFCYKRTVNYNAQGEPRTVDTSIEAMQSKNAHISVNITVKWKG